MNRFTSAMSALFSSSTAAAPGTIAEVKDSFLGSKRIWAIVAFAIVAILYKDVVGAMIWPMAMVTSIYVICESWSKIKLAELSTSTRAENAPDYATLLTFIPAAPATAEGKALFRLKAAILGFKDDEIERLVAKLP